MYHPLSNLFNDNTENLIFEQASDLINPEDFDEHSSEEVIALVARQDALAMSLYLKLHSMLRASNSLDATVVDYVSAPLRFNLLYFIQS